MSDEQLPEFLKPLFWDVVFGELEWGKDRNLVVRRILQSGNWEAVRWLRKYWGDTAISAWIEAHHGSRLNPRQLRYWQVVLEMPARTVDEWVSQARGTLWERRINP